jgi:hypothetical protein
VTDEKWWVDLIDPRHVIAESGFIARTAPEHAYLISAAPELFKSLEYGIVALEIVCEWLERGGGGPDFLEAQRRLGAAKEAISKAEGPNWERGDAA